MSGCDRSILTGWNPIACAMDASGVREAAATAYPALMSFAATEWPTPGPAPRMSAVRVMVFVLVVVVVVLVLVLVVLVGYVAGEVRGFISVVKFDIAVAMNTCTYCADLQLSGDCKSAIDLVLLICLVVLA